MANALLVDPCLERHLTGHKQGLNKVKFSPINNTIATCSKDCSVILWNLKQGARCMRFDAHTKSVSDISWSPQGNLIASASDDRTVKIWQPKIHGVSNKFIAHTSAVSTLDFNCSACTLVTGSHDKTIKLWDAGQQRLLHTINMHNHFVNATRFSPDGELFASCSEDFTVRLYDPRIHECVKSIQKGRFIDSVPRTLAWHPFGKYLAVAFECGRIRIFDIRNGEIIQFYFVHGSAVNDLTFHPNGKFMASASDDNMVKILDIIEGRPAYTLLGHKEAVKSASFSENGNLLASGSDDKKLFVWRTSLNTSDSELYKERLKSSTTSPDTKAVNADGNTIEDNSILIDSRHSTEYERNDENVQVGIDNIISTTEPQN